MSAFDKLRQQTRKGTEALEKRVANESKGKTDDRFWKLSVNKAQVGSAVIRFLPACDGEEFPYIRKYTHAFELPKQGSKNWYYSECHTTIDREDCPICAMNNASWNAGTKEGQDLARYRKRTLSYVANIYIVDDPANPDNNGKVFLFSFGPRIFSKIESALTPEFADMKKFNPFDLWEGATLRLRSRELDGQRNYDLSAWDEPSALLQDDAELERIWNSQYKLLPEIAESKYEKPEVLMARYNKLMGGKPAPAQPAPGGDDSEQFQQPARQESKPAPAAATAKQEPVKQELAPEPEPQPEPAKEQPAAETKATGGTLADKYRQMLKK